MPASILQQLPLGACRFAHGYSSNSDSDDYEAAQIEATDEGIILKPSPPLVEPDDKRAGYTLE
jgi:hypothetical protein